MKVIYVSKQEVQQGLSFNLERNAGCIKIGDEVRQDLLWKDLKKTPRKVINLYIKDWVCYAVISGPTIKSLI